MRRKILFQESKVWMRMVTQIKYQTSNAFLSNLGWLASQLKKHLWTYN